MKIRLTSSLSRRSTNSFLILAAATCLLSACSFVSQSSAQGTTLSLKFYKRGTQEQITSAAAGSTVTIVATVEVPATAAGTPISVNAVATLKVVGVAVPYKIPMANVSVPNTNPQDGGALVQSGVQQGELRIPKSTPKGTSIKVKATATAGGSVSIPFVAKLSIL